MGKFNKAKKSVSTATVNLAGGKAFKQSTKLELLSLVLTSFLKDKFYESGKEQQDRLVDLIQRLEDKKFVAKAAIYARNVFGMRSVTHVMAGELVKSVKGEQWVKNAINQVVHRPDDMLEILSYVRTDKDTPIPNSLKKGLALAINNFSPYQLAKYKASNSGFKMVDLVNLVHPKIKSELEECIKNLVEGELKNANTWERKLSDAGQAVKEIENDEEKEEKLEELKSNAWKELITEKKIGIFALLRNLRNIAKQSPESIDAACELLVNEEAIKKSLILPFRFKTAYDNLKTTDRRIVSAVSKALDISVSNVPKLPGKTAVVIDTSGSMTGFTNDAPINKASIFAAILYKSNNADLYQFSERCSEMKVNPDDTVMTISKYIEEKAFNGGTDFSTIFPELKKKYERVIILSDMQGWMESSYCSPSKTFKDYKKNYNDNVKVFSFDLNGYGTLEFPERNVICLAGWSDKVFDLMAVAEEDKDAMIKKIEQIEL